MAHNQLNTKFNIQSLKQFNLQQFALQSDFNFVLTMWGLSRLLILLTFWGIAPLIPVPPRGVSAVIGLEALSWWDGQWYIEIAKEGYSYVNDHQYHSVAFFPLLPLLMRGLMVFGFSPLVAGILINNTAFFGALLLIYYWLKEKHGERVARWSVATLSWCPYSLYGTVLYTEGLFLLLTTATLWCFEKEQYGKVALLGILTTATRSPGVAMIPAFLIMAVWKRKPPVAYLASVAMAGGIVLYSVYCGLKFGDPLAFANVQIAWGRIRGFDWVDWQRVLMYTIIGVQNWNNRQIQDVFYPVMVLLIGWLGLSFWYFRARLGAFSSYGMVGLLLILWLLAGDSFLRLGMVWGGLILLLVSCRKLSPVVILYGLFNLGIILSSGRSGSSERLAYGIVSLSMGAGLVLARYPRFGYGLMGFFGLLLVTVTIRFAQQTWVA
ncbi:hypothetical protein K4A83_08215 [Spirulina subsalsa FACHB-351]|uniref:Glycosyltransferase RgtA/B/C/D-like domain-containing protein n=1 Tax=Spirulina subsalsa FACHB-351 TaxID=234711 RepID=A0ABT3L452_9CYAN|nr:hypothetical protein [Spirulina subsalsa]MCW6036255.1 hypothetical protein [Spirulina subsalsa FACHB-351]